jgi:hypothetical protein
MKIICLLTLLFLFTSCEKIVEYELPKRNNANLIENGDFELGNLYGWILDADNENSIKINNEFIRDGSFSVKLTLAPNDISKGANRVEMVQENTELFGKLVQYKWSFYFDSEYKLLNKFVIITQFHDYPDFFHGESWNSHAGYPPPLSFLLKNDTLSLVSGKKNFTSLIISKEKIVKNKWYDVSLEIYLASDSTGFIDCTINDKKMTPFNGKDYRYFIPTVYNRLCNYPKFGYYVTGGNKTDHINSIYFDGISSTILEVSDLY